MKKKFLFLFLISVVFLVFAVSCSSDDEEGEVDAKTNCNSNLDCDHYSYCDLENPKQDAELGTLVYYCKKRQLCTSQADCPKNWKCKESEGFCITNKEAEVVFCSSNSDCMDPNYPKCNLASGECEQASSDWGNNDNGDTEIPDSDEPDTNDNDNADSDTSDTETDTVSDNDADTSSNDIPLGKTLMTEDFEEGGAKWKIVPASEENPCWKIGTPSSGPGEAHGGGNVAATNLEGTYPAKCKDLFYYEDSMKVPPAGKPEITFYAWVDLIGNGYSPFDYVEVVVKKSGDVWELVDSGVALSADTPSSPLAALDNHKTKITKQLGTQYYKFTGDLSPFKGEVVDIGFRFTSDESDEAAGFYLDDVAVTY
ncbi:hypothetical protein II898_07655 [bacterium]|nr:hypothetical protein [bacterium]